MLRTLLACALLLPVLAVPPAFAATNACTAPLGPTFPSAPKPPFVAVVGTLVTPTLSTCGLSAVAGSTGNCAGPAVNFAVAGAFCGPFVPVGVPIHCGGVLTMPPGGPNPTRAYAGYDLNGDGDILSPEVLHGPFPLNGGPHPLPPNPGPIAARVIVYPSNLVADPSEVTALACA